MQSICCTPKVLSRGSGRGGSLYKLWAQLLDQFSREEHATKATEMKEKASRDHGLRIEQGERF